MSQKPADTKPRRESSAGAAWNGEERRRADDRRRDNRRLDERRASGIGEIIDDRREEVRGRRKTDRRGENERRNR